MNVKDLSVEKLQSLAYQEICKANNAQRNIQILESELIERQKEDKPKEETGE